MKLTDYLTAINYTKEPLMSNDDQIEKDYVPFVVNRCLSYFVDTVLHANQMNQLSQLDNKMQFDYYLHSIRKRKRYSKWLKNELDDDLGVVKKYYNYSNSKTKDIIKLLTKENIEEIKEFLSGGGLKSEKRYI